MIKTATHRFLNIPVYFYTIGLTITNSTHADSADMSAPTCRHVVPTMPTSVGTFADVSAVSEVSDQSVSTTIDNWDFPPFKKCRQRQVSAETIVGIFADMSAVSAVSAADCRRVGSVGSVGRKCRQVCRHFMR